jgi:hypothetical protein
MVHLPYFDAVVWCQLQQFLPLLMKGVAQKEGVVCRLVHTAWNSTG